MIEAITGVELAKLVGISDRQVRTLAGKGMPRNPDGTYPAASAVAWYVNWKITGGAPPDLLSARTRREAALAAKAELELAKMCGELMTVAEYTRVIGDTFSRVAAKLNALPNRAAGHMIGLRTREEALRRLQAEVDEVRRELYEAEDVAEAEAA